VGTWPDPILGIDQLRRHALVDQLADELPDVMVITSPPDERTADP
jgi:hypothetical protein